MKRTLAVAAMSAALILGSGPTMANADEVKPVPPPPTPTVPAECQEMWDVLVKAQADLGDLQIDYQNLADKLRHSRAYIEYLNNKYDIAARKAHWRLIQVHRLQAQVEYLQTHR